MTETHMEGAPPSWLRPGGGCSPPWRPGPRRSRGFRGSARSSTAGRARRPESSTPPPAPSGAHRACGARRKHRRPGVDRALEADTRNARQSCRELRFAPPGAAGRALPERGRGLEDAPPAAPVSEEHLGGRALIPRPRAGSSAWHVWPLPSSG